jgi:hypothetical protein
MEKVVTRVSLGGGGGSSSFVSAAGGCKRRFGEIRGDSVRSVGGEGREGLPVCFAIMIFRFSRRRGQQSFYFTE